MSYQPFLIAPFGTGLDTDMSPWLLPQDAFSNIVNGHIHHGVVEKRDGYTFQGDLVHQDQANWVISDISIAAGVVTVSVVGVGSLVIADTIEIRSATVTTELNNNKYTISAANFTGTTFELDNVDGSNFPTGAGGAQTGVVMLIPGNRVMGLHRYIDLNNVKEVIAFDQTRACKYNPTNEQYDPLDSADIMDASATNDDFIWADNWASTASSTAVTNYRLYFTNGRALNGGLNGIRFYDGGTTTTLFNPTINSGVGGPIINGCKLLFAYRQRLVLLNTFEGANSFAQRARWSQAQGPSIADGWDDNVAGKGGFVDAPTGDHIISAEFIQDILIVYFTNSVWTLRATADPALPFRWDKINDFRACDAKMSTEQFDRYVISAGIRGITATDGVETRRFDNKIEDFVDETINDAQFTKVFSKRSYGQRRLWMLYAKVEEDEPGSALIYDEESAGFSKYDIAMNALGYGGAAQDSTISDFGDQTIFQFADDTLTDYFFDEGSEIFLGGNRSGEVYILESGGDDLQKLFQGTIVDVTAASPGVVQMTADIGLSDGDTITISGIALGSMVELNDREFTVAGKSGNSFQLAGENTTGYAAYVAGSGGNVRTVNSSSISFQLDSAAWNPWMSEGKQAQMGYVDLFLDTDQRTVMTVEFYVNNDDNPYASSVINLLPNLVERGSVAGITNANPAQVTSNNHGLNTTEEVSIYNVTGMEGVNGGPYIVTVVNKDNFTIATDTTNYGIYSNGGVITELPYASEKAWKRVYAGGTGYQHKIKITSEGKDRPLNIHAFMPWFKPRSVRPI